MPDSQIGKYRILERIARGGMGTIYRAYDPVLDRPVALKVISSEIDVTDELRGRFFREAQACARLSHPNIVIVYDMGEDDGRLFIVMELLDGEEMRRLIAEKRPMPLEDKLSVMRQVCEGLHYAHQHGVVHRDIKPGNIMRLRNGQVKILDFGIAQLANAVDSLTRTGLIMGTLRYIAPEQVQGRADHRSDIYSAGAAFYELLSLRPPFDGGTAMQLLEQIRVEDPQPLDQVDPTIPADLAAIVARAMRKDPDERFTDLGQMRLGIEQVQRALAEEGRRISDRLRIQRDRLERIDTTLAERIGSARNPVPTEREEPRHLAALKALEGELGARIETAEDTLRRADALGPAIERAQELLRDGDFTGAIADLEAVVAEMPEHTRAVRDLSDARAHAATGRRERLAVQLLQDARAALHERSFALCVEILKQADDVTPPDHVAQEIASLRQIALTGLAAQTETERARERMTEARSRAEGAAPLYAPALWDEAEAKAADAHAVSLRGAFEEAAHAYDAAAAAYGLFETAAQEEQLRERDAKATLDQALGDRQAAVTVGAPRGANDVWTTAESRLADGRAAVNERSFERAAAILEEAATLFRQAEERAKTVRRRQQEQADEARDLAAKARQDAAEAQAERHAPALWKVALSRWAAGEVALGKEEYDQAVESFSRASLLYREAAKEALEERDEPHETTVVTSTSTVGAETSKAPVGRNGQTHVVGTIRAADSGTRAPAKSPDVTATVADIPTRDTAVGESSVARSKGFGRPPDDEALSGDSKRRMLRVGSLAVALGAVALVVLAIIWFSPHAPAPPQTPPGAQAPQAPQPPAAQAPQVTASAPPPSPDATGERKDRAKTADEEVPKTLPARSGPDASSSSGGGTPDRRTPQPQAEKPAIEGVSGQGRRAAEQSGAATAAARKSAERAAAAFYAPKQLGAAEAKEKEGVDALARSDFPTAIRLLTEAKSDYRAAEQEARRESDAERQTAPLRASVEQSRATTVTRRQQALAADAERLAMKLLDAAEAKHAEADSLAKSGSLAAAVRAYNEASERYLEATQRAQTAAGTK